MAVLTVGDLRASVRAAMLDAGLRGFVRFAPEGDDALFLSDALSRGAVEEKAASFLQALKKGGYTAMYRLTQSGTLLALMPGDFLLFDLAEGASMPQRFDWDSALAPVYALADRWMRALDKAPDMDGKRLMLETARLLWRPRQQVIEGLHGLRVRASVMQRRGECGGLRVCGGMLANWLNAQVSA